MLNIVEPDIVDARLRRTAAFVQLVIKGRKKISATTALYEGGESRDGWRKVATWEATAKEIL